MDYTDILKSINCNLEGIYNVLAFFGFVVICFFLFIFVKSIIDLVKYCKKLRKIRKMLNESSSKN